jgi:hypothetical protein
LPLMTIFAVLDDFEVILAAYALGQYEWTPGKESLKELLNAHRQIGQIGGLHECDKDGHHSVPFLEIRTSILLKGWTECRWLCK